MTPRSVLLYHPEEAPAYARLVRAPRGSITLHTCATPDEAARVIEDAEHGEGFWTDHWTYNLDLLESYLALYPERRRALLFEQRRFTFYDNPHVVAPRLQRYRLVHGALRQLHGVVKDAEKEALIRRRGEDAHLMRIEHGRGEIYRTILAVKMLCIIANKAASISTPTPSLTPALRGYGKIGLRVARPAQVLGAQAVSPHETAGRVEQRENGGAAGVNRKRFQRLKREREPALGQDGAGTPPFKDETEGAVTTDPVRSRRAGPGGSTRRWIRRRFRHAGWRRQTAGLLSCVWSRMP